MFDIGWTEMLVIAVVMIVVVGPKDLPKMLRTFGRTMAKMRAMAGDFQKQFNEAMREAELDDVKKSVESLKSLNPAGEIRKHLNPLEKAAADVRAGIDTAMKPTPKPSDPTARAGAVDAAVASSPEPAAARLQPAKDPKPAAKPAGGRGKKAGPAEAVPPASAPAAAAATRPARRKKPAGTSS